MNLSAVKWAQSDKTQSRELLGLFICVCIALCTIVAHNTAQNRPDNFFSYPPDNHHCSVDVYLREGWGQGSEDRRSSSMWQAYEHVLISSTDLLTDPTKQSHCSVPCYWMKCNSNTCNSVCLSVNVSLITQKTVYGYSWDSRKWCRPGTWNNPLDFWHISRSGSRAEPGFFSRTPVSTTSLYILTFNRWRHSEGFNSLTGP